MLCVVHCSLLQPAESDSSSSRKGETIETPAGGGGRGGDEDTVYSAVMSFDKILGMTTMTTTTSTAVCVPCRNSSPCLYPPPCVPHCSRIRHVVVLGLCCACGYQQQQQQFETHLHNCDISSRVATASSFTDKYRRRRRRRRRRDAMHNFKNTPRQRVIVS